MYTLRRVNSRYYKLWDIIFATLQTHNEIKSTINDIFVILLSYHVTKLASWYDLNLMKNLLLV